MTTELTDEMALYLCQARCENFYNEQADRFDWLDGEGTDPSDPIFDGGTLYWCEGPSEWLMLMAYEQQQGHKVTLLFDCANSSTSSYVVVSTRPFVWS